MSERWPRDLWAEAVWSSSLRPLERLVALAYADHARDGETAWATYGRLMDRTGLSRDAVARALRGVVGAGWLVEVEPARQHRATVYLLAVPQRSVTQTADDASDRGDVPLSSTGDGPLGTSAVRLASPAVRLPSSSSPCPGHNLSSDLSPNHKARMSRRSRVSTAPRSWEDYGETSRAVGTW